MTPLPEMLAWVASHANKFRRQGYEPPNHLANGTVRFYGADGTATFELNLDERGNCPDYAHDPPPSRVEIRDSDGAILYTEDA